MENSIRNSESTVEKLQADIDASKEATEDLKRDNNELLQLQDLGRRLRDETDRISEKRTQMASRKDELSMVRYCMQGINIISSDYLNEWC